MKARWQIVVAVLALGAASVSAQQKGLETASRAGDSDFIQSNARIAALLNQEQTPANSDLSLGKKVRASGPVIHLIKGEKATETPRRMLDLVNPFAPAKKIEPVEKTRELNSHAWSTMVGLHPGGSVFPDARTHEPSMSLVTVGR
jgi:hypothetical protein